jgi:hypothetical protein
MEEKEVGKGVCNKPLKYACRGLEEGNKEIILPSKSTPTLGGPSNQAGKHHHKPKMYGIVCFYCKKRVIRLAIVGTLEGQETHAKTIANTIHLELHPKN